MTCYAAAPHLVAHQFERAWRRRERICRCQRWSGFAGRDHLAQREARAFPLPRCTACDLRQLSGPARRGPRGAGLNASRSEHRGEAAWNDLQRWHERRIVAKLFVFPMRSARSRLPLAGEYRIRWIAVFIVKWQPHPLESRGLRWSWAPNSQKSRELVKLSTEFAEKERIIYQIEHCIRWARVFINRVNLLIRAISNEIKPYIF